MKGLKALKISLIEFWLHNQSAYSTNDKQLSLHSLHILHGDKQANKLINFLRLYIFRANGFLYQQQINLNQ